METKECFIGICGATRSGKSTLSRKIAKLISVDEKKIIHLDRYFSKELVAKYKKNREIPEVINWDKLTKDINDKERIITYQNNSFIISEGFYYLKSLYFIILINQYLYGYQKKNVKKGEWLQNLKLKNILKIYYGNHILKITII